MSELLLIRHGQASFGSTDYDALSELGHKQARLLGQYLVDAGIELDGFYSGSLRRQLETAEAVAECYRRAGGQPPAVQIDHGYNELDNEAQIKALAPKLAVNDAHADRLLARAHASKKDFQKLLKVVFEAWQAGTVEDDSLESWLHFKTRVLKALGAVREERGEGSASAIFTSGGVIATIVAQVLQMPDSAVYSVFEPVINCSITRLLYNSERISLSSYNEFSFLQAQVGPADASGIISYR